MWNKLLTSRCHWRGSVCVFKHYIKIDVPDLVVKQDNKELFFAQTTTMSNGVHDIPEIFPTMFTISFNNSFMVEVVLLFQYSASMS